MLSRALEPLVRARLGSSEDFLGLACFTEWAPHNHEIWPDWLAAIGEANMAAREELAAVRNAVRWAVQEASCNRRPRKRSTR